MAPFFADPSASFLVPAGSGAFLCSVRLGYDVSADNAQIIHVHARTWVHRDQIE
jgi:hypothetical protein